MSTGFQSAFISCLFLIAAFYQENCLAEYVEGIDTTDVNGYGLDSAFRIDANGRVLGQFISYYGFHFGGGSGLFNCSFDDIKIAAGPNLSGLNTSSTLFSVWNNNNNLYSKIQILNKLPDSRYVFKFGTNSTPLDTMLTPSNYDRSIRYKPNNVYNFYSYIGKEDTLSWEPPIPNNNHLLGYIYYESKPGVTIDTNLPINLAQWDSIAFFSGTHSGNMYCYKTPPPCIGDFVYMNLVAVYSEGKSNFLQGWTFFGSGADNVKKLSEIQRVYQNNFSIKVSSAGVLIGFQQLPKSSKISSFSIYNINSRQVARFTDVKNNQVFWNASDRTFVSGLYFVKAEFPDGKIVSQKLLLAR
jgi:hypothetical protein